MWLSQYKTELLQHHPKSYNAKLNIGNVSLNFSATGNCTLKTSVQFLVTLHLFFNQQKVMMLSDIRVKIVRTIHEYVFVRSSSVSRYMYVFMDFSRHKNMDLKGEIEFCPFLLRQVSDPLCHPEVAHEPGEEDLSPEERRVLERKMKKILKKEKRLKEEGEMVTVKASGATASQQAFDYLTWWDLHTCRTVQCITTCIKQ